MKQQRWYRSKKRVKQPRQFVRGYSHGLPLNVPNDVRSRPTNAMKSQTWQAPCSVLQSRWRQCCCAITTDGASSLIKHKPCRKKRGPKNRARRSAAREDCASDCVSEQHQQLKAVHIFKPDFITSKTVFHRCFMLPFKNELIARFAGVLNMWTKGKHLTSVTVGANFATI